MNCLNMFKGGNCSLLGTKGQVYIDVRRESIFCSLPPLMKWARTKSSDTANAHFQASLTPSPFYRWPFLLFYPKALCPWLLIKAVQGFQELESDILTTLNSCGSRCYRNPDNSL